jgi:hypothetical protein
MDLEHFFSTNEMKATALFYPVNFNKTNSIKM